MTDAVERLAEDYFAAYTTAAPTEAHLRGDYAQAERFEVATRAEEDRQVAELRELATRAAALDDDALDDRQRVTLAVVVADATARADVTEARLSELAADPIFGVQTSMPVVLGLLGLPGPEVAEAMVGKLAGYAAHLRDLADRQLEGLAAGRTSPAFAVAGTVDQLDTWLGTPIERDPLLSVLEPPSGMDAARWHERLLAVVQKQVRPAAERYRDVLRDDVAPHARPDDRCGLGWLPDGEDAYARTLRYFTTTRKSAREIHEIGLAQVAALAEEYVALGPEVVGTDDLDAIFDAMRTDPQLHFESGDQLVTASEVAMARAWDAMPDWFEVLPEARCVVQGTESGAKAFYFPPAADGSRAGTFFINTVDPEAWGTFELEAMAFHEGIPGHHLQLSIAAELDGVPEFRKHLHNSAYAEGWGLYTERLADEMGLYSGPVDRMGMYAADSLRACRLVVDTGLHAMGWSRQQAVDYMLANSPLAEGVVRPEVDRYIVSPGQATSYMIGRLEIQRMRAAAEQRQGEAFSVKAFHSAVLDSGSLPLGVLDEVVRARLP